MNFLQRSITSTKPARLTNALYFTANAMAESDLARELLFTQFGLFKHFYNIMFMDPVNTGLITYIMWNLQVLAHKRALDCVIKDREGGELLRRMFRAALSIDNNV